MVTKIMKSLDIQIVFVTLLQKPCKIASRTTRNNRVLNRVEFQF